MKNDYEFERFIINEANQTAYENAVHIAKERGQCENNPVWLQGPSKSGKTHLLYAIKRELEKNRDKRSCRVVSCHDLMREVISVLQWDIYEDVAEDFIARFCLEDIIMIEDVDYCLQGKEASQEEVFRVIEDLVKKYGRQVIITSHKLFEPFYSRMQEGCPNLTLVSIEDISRCENEDGGGYE